MKDAIGYAKRMEIGMTRQGNVWSWDKQRWERIRWKKTLADAAIDGVIPQGKLASLETMHKKLREALHLWIQRVEKGFEQ